MTVNVAKMAVNVAKMTYNVSTVQVTLLPAVPVSYHSPSCLSLPSPETGSIRASQSGIYESNIGNNIGAIPSFGRNINLVRS